VGLLDDKVVAVTGAGQGLGFEEALEIGRQGAAVVINEYDPVTGERAIAELTSQGISAALVVGDVSAEDTAKAIVAEAISEFGRLDALVNNAGTLRDRTLIKMTAEEWDTVVRVHLRGHFLTTREAASHWKSIGQPGHLVHTTSTAGLLGNFGQANYGAAKAGIAAFSTIAAFELAKFNINSNAISPAARTQMTLGAYGDVSSAADGRFDFWNPANVAPLVAVLCSDEAAHISGKVFGVQGDSVEIYQPWTSAAFIQNGDERWDPRVLASRMDELLEAGGVAPEITNPMRRIRFSMTQRA